uniref:BRI1 kinase inhibitor 1 n=1 Tax=Ananas comosus var. bracteatus TaxID=296719 RepID=A0A6V7P2Q9_ANACO|nr:unnamed protein product [Ananas comosus var. bracteatus]
MFLLHPSPPPHEFSFTLPLHPLVNSEHAATPADDIFLHGHLLPSTISTTAEDKNKNKNKKAFDAAQFLKKKYDSMVEPLLFFFNKDKESKRGEVKKKRTAHSSVPASARTSPVNSGRLAGTPTVSFSSSDKSSMEELQSAIQAAIAHCKNSIAEKGCREV